VEQKKELMSLGSQLDVLKVFDFVWLVVWISFLFFHILGIIIPTAIFFRGVETTNQLMDFVGKRMSLESVRDM